MKKKLVAITLVAALSVSAMATAFAAVPNADSNAGILFHWGGGDGIVDPPVDPPTEDWHYWGDALGLDFGDNPVTQLQRTYSSLTAARFRNAAGEVTLAEVDRQNIPNTANLFVASALPGWAVDVSIERFLGAEGVPRLSGFTLDLNRNAAPIATTGAILNTVFEPTGRIWAPTETEAGAVFRIARNGDAAIIAGAPYAGLLDVPADRAYVGAPQAVMTWTFHAGSPQS